MSMQPDNNHGAERRETWRMFLAIPLPEDVRREVDELSLRLRKGAQFTPARPSWVHTDSIHITLVFLGNTPVDKVEAIKDAAGRVAARFSPLRFEIKRLGVFPDWHRPRVLWAGMRERTHQIESLHRLLNESLVPIGFTPEAKPFHPHLTLARIKSLAGIGPLRSVVESHMDYETTPFEATELILFRSRLDPAGAIHTPVGRFPFSSTERFASGD